MRCKWAKDGDENSEFFHGIINSRLNRINDDLIPIRIDLRNIFKGKVGNCESTRFWLDNWKGGGPLNVSFPWLFRLEVNKNFLVRDRAPTVPQHPMVSISAPYVSATGPHILGSIGPILPLGLHFQWTWSRKITDPSIFS
ncbi:hypothetical protein CTI12_AA357360 [Artemisia annua]|uniref:RNA-directed DNA polymerase, eukaryota, Reverse transcriptase zinc-binding domain protein n=1 Tax=Artemisia annua TaxID=35608 RepID=A0A2U1MPH2_ARTAN|nr:hypothetical protein CTI12_AA357360 [Artemisia annua]